MEIKARLTFDTVQFDRDNEAHLVVSLKAPKIDWQQKRPAVCIIPVIDVSGSMSGQKLEYAKQSVLKLIDHLQPGDFCGLVTFESEVKTVCAPKEMTQTSKDALKAQVGQLHPMGSTNFSGGLCQGLEHLNKGDLPDGMLLRVIMFTDGQANVGMATKREDLLPLLAAQLGKGTVSAFGYGTDADQDLLGDIAKAGKGNYAFIRNPEDALSAFAKELGGLLSTYAQTIAIEVAPHNGHTVTETVSDVTAEADGNKVKVTLSDILSEEERHLVFKVKLDKQPNAFPRQSSVFDVNVQYDVLDDGKQKQHRTEEVKVKVQFVKADEAQTKPTPEVDRIVGLAQLVQAQVEAEEHAKAGHYGIAVRSLGVMGENFASRGLDDLVKVSANIGGKMNSHASYVASSGYLGSMKAAGTRAVGVSSLDAEAAMNFADLNVNLSNSAQEDMQKNFGGGVVQTHTGVAVGHGQPQVVVNPHIVINQPPVQVQPFVARPTFTPNKPPQGKKQKVAKQKSKRW